MPKKTDSSKKRIQHAALPYRRCPGGPHIEILLVTSRETRRWVVPKGWPMRGRKGHQAAACEAFEEAGLVGKAAKRRIGSYAYDKRLADGAAVQCSVRVYPFAVSAQRETWPEMAEREARWFTPSAAALVVDEPDLAALIISFEARLDREPAAGSRAGVRRPGSAPSRT